MLVFAKAENAKVPLKGARVEGFGQDSHGLWWFQVWTESPPPWESEQWFVTWDGANWALRGYGTGMDRGDYPSDIKWNDATK